jgi:hypothetical protein
VCIYRRRPPPPLRGLPKPPLASSGPAIEPAPAAVMPVWAFEPDGGSDDGCSARRDCGTAIPAEQFTRSEDGGVSLSNPIPLAPGRYIVRADFSADNDKNEIFAGVEGNGEVIFRYHTNTRFMAGSYRDWVIQLDRPTQIAPYLRFLKGTDPSLIWRGTQIVHLPAFDGYPAPVIS